MYLQRWEVKLAIIIATIDNDNSWCFSTAVNNSANKLATGDLITTRSCFFKVLVNLSFWPSRVIAAARIVKDWENMGDVFSLNAASVIVWWRIKYTQTIFFTGHIWTNEAFQIALDKMFRFLLLFLVSFLQFIVSIVFFFQKKQTVYVMVY